MTGDRRLIKDYLPIQAISANLPAACLSGRQALRSGAGGDLGGT